MKAKSKAYDKSETFVGNRQHPNSRANAPKVPGLTTWLHLGVDGKSGYDGLDISFPAAGLDTLTHSGGNFNSDKQAPFSSGIDCSGFVYQAVSYIGGPYLLSGRRETTNTINSYGYLV